MTDDFVARLRIRWEAMGDMANDERAAAATEIDTLRQSQRSLMAQVAALTETLRIVNDGMAECAESLRQERDAARREVCAHLSSESALLAIRRTPEEIAASRGWLCFPPDNPPA